MRRTACLVLLVMLLGGGILAAPAQAAPGGPLDGLSWCEQRSAPAGPSIWLTCVPSNWNGDLVVYAHGYVAPNEPVGIPEDQLVLPDGTSIPRLVTQLRFAFATTSYPRNGLVALEGAADIRALVDHFWTRPGMPPTRGRTYVAGVSEGGLIAALLAERAPDVFSGALSACGPIGDFRKQINYFGDFRVLFDYFFGQVVPIPNSPIDIAPGVMAGWESVYEPAVTRAVRTRPDLAGQLVRTSKAAVDRNDPSTVQNTITGLLWYNVFATNDAREQLGGSPYDNRGRWYWGSANDVRLNLRVQRFSADPAALAALAPYETSGRPQIPLVTLHTTGDEIIPFWHQLLYRRKFDPSGGGSFLAVPVFRYGHCNFTAKEVLRAFGLLVLRVTGGQPEGLTEQLTIEQARADFARARVPAAAQLQRDAQLQQQHAGGR